MTDARSVVLEFSSMENHAVKDPRFELQTFGTRIRGEGVGGIVGAIIAVLLIFLFYPIIASWLAMTMFY